MTAADIGHSPFLEWDVASAPMRGERTSGDMHVIVGKGARAIVAVVDGLGHGEAAAEAARRTGDAIREHREASVIALLRRCHEALAGTRGVAMSIASFSTDDDTMSWLGVGNVYGILIRADERAVPRREAIMQRGGIVGHHLPLLQAAITAVAPGDMVVFATDGVRPGFADHLQAQESPSGLARRILAKYGKGTDDALVLVARYLGRPEYEP